MRRAAEKNEGGEEIRNPRKRQLVAAATREVAEHGGNAEIGRGDQRVRADIQPEHIGTPEMAHAMRHETFGTKKPLNE